MKIRIKGNSIRFRLTKTEVQLLAETGVVEEMTAFPNGDGFRYALTTSSTTANDASFSEGKIAITLSKSWAEEWSNNEEVGTTFELETPSGALAVLVEKDFNCLVVRENEDESDHFKNPLSEHPAC
ncbi:MAG: hypothetical protein P8H59_02845 [Flavobacteriales bacterium]|nr:hypothetical protein [Flavobacteriales bacterium]MDG1779862.1 hypothetical protein [Flavobacteriales bacterium]